LQTDYFIYDELLYLEAISQPSSSPKKYNLGENFETGIQIKAK